MHLRQHDYKQHFHLIAKTNFEEQSIANFDSDFDIEHLFLLVGARQNTPQHQSVDIL